MSKKNFSALVLFCLSFFLANSLWIDPTFLATISAQVTTDIFVPPSAVRKPSLVMINGRLLTIYRRFAYGTLDYSRPYIIRGIDWSPATRATEFFFDWAGRNPPGNVVFRDWMKGEFRKYYKGDIKLIKDMKANTVRVYSDFGNDGNVYTEILDECYRNGISVIMTVAATKDDLEKDVLYGKQIMKRYLAVVKACKDHPAILMWSLGNEWNMDGNLYYGYNSVIQAAAATNAAARNIRLIDPNHPVSSCLGDRFKDNNYYNTIKYIVNACPYVEAWGMNVYRGNTFGYGMDNLFNQWRVITYKPLYLTEFGTDSFEARDSNSDGIPDCWERQGVKLFKCEGRENEVMQANHDIGLWIDIKNHLSVLNDNEICLGGLVFEFNDELWKVGCFHAGLGYDSGDQAKNDAYYNGNTDYAKQDTGGFFIKGGHPDNAANEEYFGVVNADRNKLKSAYYQLKSLYSELEDNTPPVITNVSLAPIARSRFLEFNARIIDYGLGVKNASVTWYWMPLRGYYWMAMPDLPMANSGNNVYKARLPDYIIVHRGNIRYCIVAYDKAGNRQITNVYYFTIK